MTETPRRRPLLTALRAALCGGLVLLSPACVPRDAGYEDVRKLVSRTGHDVRWRHLEGPGKSEQLAREILAQPLTAESAIRVALLNNADIQAAFEDLGVARADLVSALGLPNPSAEAGLRFGREGSPKVELSLSEDLTQIALLPLRSGAARADLAATRFDVAGRVMDVLFDVRRAFYEAVAAQQTLELRTTVLQAQAAAASSARAIHAAGNVTDLDLTSQQVLADEARLNVAAAEATRVATRERLNALLGVWGGEASWTTVARLADPEPVDLSDLEGQVVGRSVELESIRQRHAAATRRARAARVAGWLPELKAGVALEQEDGQWGYGPMLELELPLFYQGQGEVDRADALARQQTEQYAATAVRIRAALRTVVARMVSARERATYLREVLLPRREQIVRETQLQFNAMGVSVFQLLVARRDQVETARAYVDTLREYWLAYAALEQLRAGRLPTSGGSELSAPTEMATTGESGGH